MIIEGLVTTLDEDGTPHLAPMGPRVSPDFSTLLLRPFPTSHTCANLLRTREGVFHITDDALLIAKAAVGEAGMPAHEPAVAVRGVILTGACRAYEFRVTAVDDSKERVHLEAAVVRSITFRDFVGFNRAKHAVVEAAILATRFHLLPAVEIDAEYKKLRVIVDKTGGPAEHEGMTFLEGKWAAHRGAGR
jgi:hypothetical protein